MSTGYTQAYDSHINNVGGVFPISGDFRGNLQFRYDASANPSLLGDSVVRY